MRRRASNVYGRPLFLGKVGGIAFAITLFAFALLARTTSRGEGQGAHPAARPDTEALVLAEKRASARLGEAEGALVAARARHREAAMQRDAIAPDARARRDSLSAAAAELTR